MEWTKDKPTEAGIYLLLSKASVRPSVAEVSNLSGKLIIISPDIRPLDDASSSWLWLGPVPSAPVGFFLCKECNINSVDGPGQICGRCQHARITKEKFEDYEMKLKITTAEDKDDVTGK